jgi:hypothetical protein
MFFSLFLFFNKIVLYLISLFFFILYNNIYKSVKEYWEFSNYFKLIILSNYFILFFNLYINFLISNIEYLFFNLYYYVPNIIHTNIIFNILKIYYEIFFVFNIFIKFIYQKVSINYILLFVLKLKLFYYLIYAFLAIVIIVINFIYFIFYLLYIFIRQIIALIIKIMIIIELKNKYDIFILNMLNINNKLSFWKNTNKFKNKKSIKVFIKLNYSKTRRIIRDWIFRIKYRLGLMLNYLSYYFCFFLWNPIIYASLKQNINLFYYYFFSLLSIIKSSITYIIHYLKWKK